MKRISTLSECVQDYIDTFHDDLPPEELAESKQTRKMFDVIVRDLISSRETLVDGTLRDKLPEISAPTFPWSPRNWSSWLPN